MADYVVLKRLTEKSDLGWFRSIFYNRSLKGRQKGITLNKAVINDIWPNLLVRQVEYEAAKAAEVAANKQGDAVAAARAKGNAKVAGHLPIRVELHGPGGKKVMIEERLLALQDKNWRLNGAFIDDPPDDPNRFDSVLREGDLALIGFDGKEQPTIAVVILLAAGAPADADLFADLSVRVGKGGRSMIRLAPDEIRTMADKHNLPAGHVVRILAGDPVVEAALEEIAQGDIAAGIKVTTRRVKPVNAEELAAGMEANARTGHLGEKIVDTLLANQRASGGADYNWMWPNSAAHPYDFEILNADGEVDAVIDAKSTSSVWTANFYMSSGELAHAAISPVPYRIYRLSEVGPTGAWLRISDDIRLFAKTVAQAFLDAAPRGVRATTIAVSPLDADLSWPEPAMRLPPTPL